MINTPQVRQSSVTIVGLSREYSPPEVYNLLQKIDIIGKFSVANKLEDHLSIHTIIPLKNNPSRYQVFASLSETLREGFRQLGDKLVMGINTCKVYDRTKTKRCNKCQMFGHFMISCPSQQSHCGKCSGNHSTKDCTSDERGCINCIRNKIEPDEPHSAFYHKCPSLLQFQELLKRTQHTESNLNSERPQNEMVT